MVVVSDGLAADTQSDLRRIASIGEDCAQGLIIASLRATELSEKISQLADLIPSLENISESATTAFTRAATDISKLQAESSQQTAAANDALIRQIMKLATEHRETLDAARLANKRFEEKLAKFAETIDRILIQSEGLASQRFELRVGFAIILLFIVVFGLSAHVST